MLNWYRSQARDLPWRRTHDPYAIWVSEIMLQQTQVETVIPYYRRFLLAFPTVGALAGAPEEKVLKLWEGLGYYRRARHLQAAARLVVKAHTGQLPADAQAWQALPGVGAYTAGAIASIALGEPAPILDGNVKRVLSRIFVVSGPAAGSVVLKKLWALAADLVPAKAPGDFNQALMELGALICRVDGPRCPACPVRKKCRAYASGDPENWPQRMPGKRRPHKTMVAGLVQVGGKLLLGQRPENGLLGGLWELPGGEVKSGETYPAALRRIFRSELGVDIEPGKAAAPGVQHAYTHFSLTLHAYRVRLSGGTPRARFHQALRWVTPGQMVRLAVPLADRKVLRICLKP
ncbi:MAG: A/G-specific adenine glycosylase [Candidatus Firestonebacteria bacterium]|nr:A/G-specific adenine glycosylase [Candidatus Firestonebacteria bacterium]